MIAAQTIRPRQTTPSPSPSGRRSRSAAALPHLTCVAAVQVHGPRYRCRASSLSMHVDDLASSTLGYSVCATSRSALVPVRSDAATPRSCLVARRWLCLFLLDSYTDRSCIAMVQDMTLDNMHPPADAEIPDACLPIARRRQLLYWVLYIHAVHPIFPSPRSSKHHDTHPRQQTIKNHEPAPPSRPPGQGTGAYPPGTAPPPPSVSARTPRTAPQAPLPSHHCHHHQHRPRKNHPSEKKLCKKHVRMCRRTDGYDCARSFFLLLRHRLG
ncbi:uncharacterized protein J3D65DRAFT_454582 [Phyllosticta citribraziliensis]|uniref:Uncharacterized protein n=1 Tax=Phyllosticta citribraziliensis TaxID=989973 RepID=A0ABR1LEW8_9PEZI